MRRGARGQSGQALVAALITMVLLFAVTGGLAVAISAALLDQRAQAADVLRDVQAASAANAVAAAVAGGGPCPTGALGAGGEVTSYACSEIDWVLPSSVHTASLSPAGGCRIGQIQAGAHIAAWLGSGASAYVDGNASGCAVSGPACVLSTSGGFLVNQDCDLTSTPTAYIHVSGGTERAARYSRLAGFVPAPGDPLPLGPAPGSILSADLNGDGVPDLVVGDQSANKVSVLLGNGDGTLRLSATYSVPDSPSSIVAGRFRGSQHPVDLAITGSDANTVCVLLGIGGGAAGNGTFQSCALYPVGQQPMAIAAADVTTDGNLDLAVANQYDNSITVLVGAGDGTFQPRAPIAVGSTPSAIAEIDVGPSGRPDLVVANRGDGTVSLLNFSGSGGFLSRTDFAAGASPAALAVADFNHDGVPDVAVANNTSAGVSILRGSNNSLALATTVPAGSGPVAVAVGNFGGAFGTDLAIANQLSGSVTVLIQAPDTSFRPIIGGGASVGHPAGLGVGDFNRDGRTDLVSTDPAGGQLWVMLRNPARIFGLVASASAATAHEEADVLTSPGSVALTYEGGL